MERILGSKIGFYPYSMETFQKAGLSPMSILHRMINLACIFVVQFH